MSQAKEIIDTISAALKESMTKYIGAPMTAEQRDQLIDTAKRTFETVTEVAKDRGVITSGRIVSIRDTDGRVGEEGEGVVLELAVTPRAGVIDDLPERIRNIIEQLHTQDNLATADPMYVVQHKVRDYGCDRSGGDDDVIGTCYVNHDDCLVISEEQYVNFEMEGMDDEGDDFNPKDWTETAWRDRWQYVTVAFTRKGCEDYISANGHNLNETRIYVDTAYRNTEWIAVRKFLMEMKEPP